MAFFHRRSPVLLHVVLHSGGFGITAMIGKKTKETRDPKTPEERILFAATEEFAAKGFFGARTQAVADAAGVNKAMLHYYFRSKENLYREVIKAAFGKILRDVSQAWLSPGDLEDRLEVVIASYIDNYSKNPGFLKIVLREVVDGGKRFRSAFKDIEKKQPLASGFTPEQMVARLASELGLNNMGSVHMIINIVGMCAISFISPLFLEAVLHMDISDFDSYLKERRTAIKDTALAYAQSLVSASRKESRG
jgi:TetR/AcrR family transcriptional regulator